MRFKILLFSAMVLLISACTENPIPDKSEQHVVGSLLTSVTSMTNEQGADESFVALFDDTVHRIHVFDLDQPGSKPTSLTPVEPSGTHYVLFDPNGNYVIDFSKKHMTVFNRAGQIKGDYNFVGLPISASYKPSKGYLIVYDDLHAVGMFKLDNDGNVIARWMSGPVVSGSLSVSSGDLEDDGKLVLGLSDNSMMVVDVDQSMAQQNYVSTNQFPTTMTDLQWIAPVHDSPTQVLVLSSAAISLVDTSTGTVLDSSALTTAQTVIKTSKFYDPHFIVQSSSQKNLVFAKGSKLVTQTTYNVMENVLSSRLNLTQNSWTIVDTTLESFVVDYFGLATGIVYDDPNGTTQKRTLKRWTVDHQAPIYQIDMPDDAKLELTEAHVFELFPSTVGHAKYCLLGSTQCAPPYDFFNKPFEH